MINRDEFEDFVYIQALKNAYQFDGKANSKALIGKCVAQFPEMKKAMNEWVPILETIVEKINSLDIETQKQEIEKLNPEFFEIQKEKKQPQKKDGLPDLGIEDNNHVVVRFEPAPSGYLHLGHLFALVANYELKRKYGGKFILRISDTNPENISKDNYDKVIEDVKWMCEDDIDEIFYQSKRLPIYYKYLRTLFELGFAYVCECDSETFKAYTDSCEKCPHAKMGREDKSELFEKFMNGELNENGAVVRFKADVTHKNPAMRSFSLARINTTPHPLSSKTQYVWPTMNLAVAVDDVLMGLTHVVRGKDHEINMERQKLIHRALGMKSPEYFHFGRMKFLDLDLSKSSLSHAISQSHYSGWDDPRVPSLVSYRKRGFRPEAFREYIKSLGISKRDSKITSDEYHKGLYFYNKQIIEPVSKHYFFVHNPKAIHITNIKDYPEKELELAKHPENKKLGFRHIPVIQKYFIDSIDFENLEEGDVFRLMHFGNFKIEKKNEESLEIVFLSQNYDKTLPLKRNIQFVNANQYHNVEIVLQDNSKLLGVCEDMKIDERETIQFERFGFVTCTQKKENKLEFYFTHS